MGKVTTIVEQLVTPYLEEHGFELVETEYVKEGSNWYLRIYVDKEGGSIDIDDCGMISEYISERLDELDPIKDAYFLEVSSPGAERPLKTERDYERSVGKHVYIETKEPIDSLTEFEGVLEAFEGDKIVVSTTKSKTEIPMHFIKKARLAIVL